MHCIRIAGVVGGLVARETPSAVIPANFLSPRGPLTLFRFTLGYFVPCLKAVYFIKMIKLHDFNPN